MWEIQTVQIHLIIQHGMNFKERGQLTWRMTMKLNTFGITKLQLGKQFNKNIDVLKYI